MFQSDPAHAIGEGEQEVVAAIGLSHQRAMGVEMLGLCLQQVGAIGENIQPHRHGRRCVQLHPLDMPPGEYGRVHEGLQGNRPERRGGTASGGSLEGRRELPAVRKH